MLKDTNWKRFFAPRILERGYNCFLEGTVTNLKFHNKSIIATVCGSYDYEVEITFSGDSIDNIYCTCPYAEDGNYCKHMAAVCFELDHHSEGEASAGDTDMDQDEVRQSVMQADEKTVKNFLTVLLQEDEKLFARFKVLVSPELSPADIQRFKNQVDALIEKWEGRYGFIEYREARGFIRGMDEFLEEDVQTMLESGQFRAAFDLTNHIFLRTSNVDMDDSDGGKGAIGFHCLEVWNEIADHADASLKKEMLEWFIDHMESQVPDYMAEYIDQVLETQFTEEPYLEWLLSITEEQAREADRICTSSEDPWESEYLAVVRIRRHLTFLKKRDDDWKSIQAYCKQYWKYQDIRRYYIQGCIDREYHEEAIKEIKAHLELNDSFRDRRRYLRQLKELYRKIGDEEACKKLLWELVTRELPGNMEEYCELKEFYSEEEWKPIRDKIFDSLPEDTDKAPYYEEEKMYEKLLESVLEDESLYNAGRYLEVLKDLYPKQLLEKYSKAINRMAEHTADRSTYQRWIQTLRTMQTIPGGKEEVAQIVKQWKLAYKNRRAMMDELSRL